MKFSPAGADLNYKMQGLAYDIGRLGGVIAFEYNGGRKTDCGSVSAANQG